ncbi:MAG: nitroreductase family protein [Tenuifilaceae bacterium]
MDSFIELARNRYSCRSYQNRDIPKELIEKVLEASRIAPSAVNFQPWCFIVISDNSLKKKISSCYARPWLESAPIIIVACGDHNRSWRRADGKDHCDIDLAIAIDHLMLAATDLGLATCWVCKFDVMKCASILELPSNISTIALIPLGYPADTCNPNRHNEKRKPLNEIVFWDKINL